ncbi:phage holin family protein [Candidatus Daviesbacteria bacterium]|nr:phage holin family protein [Candidatus Daviesbacteria bacterium]
MKKLLRFYLINLASLWLTSQMIKGLVFTGGIQSLLTGALVFALINIILVPVLKILLLPLNLMTLGIFSWLTNVIALYVLTTIFPSFRLISYHFPGFSSNGLTVPAITLSPLWVAILASFSIGIIVNFLHWVMD